MVKKSLGIAGKSLKINISGNPKTWRLHFSYVYNGTWKIFRMQQLMLKIPMYSVQTPYNEVTINTES
jgi:hypothetical protein